MNKAYKYRIYPTEAQKELFAKTFGCCRKVYNLMLEKKIQVYQETGNSVLVTPAMFKNEYPFLREVDSLALANEQLHLQSAYQQFFRTKKGFPKFKSRKWDRLSYTTNRVGNNIVIGERSIRLPKIGEVKARIHRKAPDDYILKSVTVTLNSCGRYYVSVLYEYESNVVPVEKIVTHIGLDYKSDGLYVASDGSFADMPKFYRLSQKRLGKEQRRLSRKAKGSNNYLKQKRKVAQVAEHIANQRRDFLHKLSAEITNQYDLIAVEDLNMRGMSRTLHLGKATMDNGYAMFLSMLEYKQRDKGHLFVKVDKFFASSQLCHCCGYKNPDTKDLSLREWTCPVCGALHHRDLNAAINIDREGLRLATA